MSRNGQAAIVIATARLPGGVAFHRHVHPVAQLAWAHTGVLTVDTAEGTWVLPPSRALWIPARVPHALGSSGVATSRSLYLPKARWRAPTVVAVSPLLAQLIVYLAEAELTQPARRRAEAVLLDLLEPLHATTIAVPMPEDDRARRVAEELRRGPADARPLAAWGREAGASARTLARIWVAETGMTFGRWRAQLRLEAALTLLAKGMPVTNVAHRVGYDSASAFVAAFRRALGVTPASYFGAG
jgi:AraC-like DNA-binding protein